MCAAEHDPVCTSIQQRLQAGTYYVLGVRAAQFAALDELYEATAHVLYDADIVFELALSIQIDGSFKGAGGGQDTYDTCLCLKRCRLHGRLHSYKRNGVFFSQSRYCSGRCRVAGHHNDISALIQQEAGYEPTSLENEFRGFVPVWAIGVV